MSKPKDFTGKFTGLDLNKKQESQEAKDTDKQPIKEDKSQKARKPESQKKESLNFKVTSEVKRKFKALAAHKGLKMNELLEDMLNSYTDQS